MMLQARMVGGLFAGSHFSGAKSIMLAENVIFTSFLTQPPIIEACYDLYLKNAELKHAKYHKTIADAILRRFELLSAAITTR